MIAGSDCGYQPHIDAKCICKHGCAGCENARECVGWPAGVTMLENPANHSKENFRILVEHYSIAPLQCGGEMRQGIIGAINGGEHRPLAPVFVVDLFLADPA